jgi:hypothetical protein
MFHVELSGVSVASVGAATRILDALAHSGVDAHVDSPLRISSWTTPGDGLRSLLPCGYVERPVEINSEVPRVHGSAVVVPDSALPARVQRQPALEFHVKQHRTAALSTEHRHRRSGSDDSLSRGPATALTPGRPARPCTRPGAATTDPPPASRRRPDCLEVRGMPHGGPCPTQPKYTASVTRTFLRAWQSPDRATRAVPASPDHRPHGARLATRSVARKLTASSHVQRWPPVRIDTRTSDRPVRLNPQSGRHPGGPEVQPRELRFRVRARCPVASLRGRATLPGSRLSRVDGFRSAPVRWRRPHHSAPSVKTAINEPRDRRLCRSPAGPPGQRFFPR